MSRQRFLYVSLVTALLLGNARPSHANSADNVGAELVVPLLAYDKQLDARVFVENHETHAVQVGVRYVGERGSSTPGLRSCGKVTLPAGLSWRPSVTVLNPRDPSSPGYCGLKGPTDLGMLLLTALDPTAPGRLSATARVEVRDTSNGSLAQVLLPGGVPLGYLDTTDNVHVAAGLEWHPFAAKPATADCFIGTFADGSGFGGQATRLRLKDGAGNQIGGDYSFAQRPFELVRLRDVFTLVGAPIITGGYEAVRAEFVISGGGDTVLPYCWTEMRGLNRSTFAMNLAQVVEPQEETRRRGIDVTLSIPTFPPGMILTLDPSERKVVHGLYVRSPDYVNCIVGSSDQLVITAVAPNGSFTVGGTTNRTSMFATPQSVQEPNDLWGLEVSWGPTAARTARVTYSISCASGNGTSLADYIFRN